MRRTDFIKMVVMSRWQLVKFENTENLKFILKNLRMVIEKHAEIVSQLPMFKFNNFHFE